MDPNTANAQVHIGPISTIPQDSSPGLLFLGYFLPALDSLSLSLPINNFLHPDGKIITNGGDPIGTEDLGKMFVMRAGKLAGFEHEVVRCWEVSGRGTRRTVMYESISKTIFKTDPTKHEVKVSEFGVIELEPFEGGEMGLAVVEMKAWLDPKPVQDWAVQLRDNNKSEPGVGH